MLRGRGGGGGLGAGLVACWCSAPCVRGAGSKGSLCVQQENAIQTMELRSYFSLYCLHQETQLVHAYLPLTSHILGAFVNSQIQGHKEVGLPAPAWALPGSLALAGLVNCQGRVTSWGAQDLETSPGHSCCLTRTLNSSGRVVPLTHGVGGRCSVRP